MKDYYNITIGTPVYSISYIDNGFSMRHGVVSQILEYEPGLFQVKLPWGWEYSSSVCVDKKEARLIAVSMISNITKQTL